MKRVLIFALLALFAMSATCAFAGLAGVKICVDPGHGGSDPGAVGNGLYEDNINLAISLKLKTKLTADAAIPVMIRTSDVYVSLQGRCDISNNNGCSRFISSHCGSGTTSGTTTYCAMLGGSAENLARKIETEMVSHMGTANRGVTTGSFYVLIHTVAPAIQCDVACIGNASDAAKLGSSTYQNEAARAYLHGLQSHYGETPHDP